MGRTSPPFVLRDDEYELVACIAETIVPSGENPESDPGANEVGVRNYFDSSLLDLSPSQQERIRQTLVIIQEESRRMFNERNFQALNRDEREAVFRKFFSDGRLKERFLEIRSICISGFYSDYHDPDYQGVSAWEWLGYGGKRISDIKKDWSFLRIYQARTESSQKENAEV